MDIEMLNVQTIMFETAARHGCACCEEPGKFGVILAESVGTFYLPNQHARTTGLPFNNLKEVWFCKGCVGIIEKALNAFIKASRERNGLPALYVEETE